MDRVNVRQICFLLAAVLPVTRLIVYPATLAYRAGNDLLWSALLNLACEGAAVWLALWLSKRTERTLFGLVQARLGKAAAKVLSFGFALFFALAAVLPLLEQRGFVLQILYENVPSFLSFTPLFVVLVFAGAQGLRALGRAADLAMPAFAVCLTALLLLALPDADFAALLPVGGRGAGTIARASLFSLPWYTGAPCLLCLCGHFTYEKGCAKKVLLAYAIGAAATLLFLGVFYAVFADIALLQQNAVEHLSKYATALTPLGRIDLLFVLALTLVLVFAACLPVRLCVLCLRETFGGPPALHACIVGVLLLGLTVLLNPAFREAQTFLTETLWPAFALFGYALPLLLALCLWEKKAGRGQTSARLPADARRANGSRGCALGLFPPPHRQKRQGRAATRRAAQSRRAQGGA